jgi:hypothetical protein
VQGRAPDRAGAVVLGTAALAPGVEIGRSPPLTFKTIANEWHISCKRPVKAYAELNLTGAARA